VEFTFSPEQQQLREAVRSFVVAESPPAYVREMANDRRGFTDAMWSRLVELGWTGVLVPESFGGLGLGMVDVAVVLEEMGRVPFPGPYLSSAVWATLAARHLGLGDLLRSLAAGATRGTIAVDELGHGDPIDRIRTRAVRRAGQWRLEGLKPVVLDGHTADWALVVARTESGVGTFLVQAPRGDLVPSWDVARKVARLEFDGRQAQPVGPPGDHTSAWRRIVDDAAVALCCELIGTTEQAFDLAVDYAKTRVQFGRPIASFQAIKHKCAEMLQRLELARVGTHYAAWASDVEDPVRAEAAAMAKAYVAEAAVDVTGESIQIHGGVGFTWDCDAHLHYRRAKQDDLLLSYSGTQLQRVADAVIG
jgi:alkylation response protein AidB-like acyl-CoA dehydrogenase